MTRAEITTPEIIAEESVVELSLRPQRLSEFIGQDRVKESLRIYIDAALARREPLDHTLFFGPPGLGKTTLAELIARELGVNIRSTSGPALEKPGDLVGTLTNLREGDILFIDEIHRLKPIIEEFLYPAMEDYKIEIRLSEGPKAQTITMQIEKFTLIGATTRLGMLTPPMRARFGIEQRLNFYPAADLEQIVHRTAEVMQVEIDEDGAQEIAKRARGTPRVANRLLRRIRDFAQVRAGGKITRKVAADALVLLEVDQLGLDDMDTRILKTIIEKFDGGPVGVGTIAAAVQRIGPTMATLLFLLYAGINGLLLSAIFLAYAHAVIASAFIITAGMFLAMSLYGFVTRRDLTSMGALLFMALIGLILASVVSMFWHSNALTVVINYVGVLIFVGLTAYDTQRLKALALQTAGNSTMASRMAVSGALALYLDFLNLFLFILSIMGDRRR